MMDVVTLLAQQGRPWHPMDHMGWGGWALMVLFWLVVIGLIVWLVVVALGRGTRREPSGEADEDRAESILRERYARGEIDEDTYRRMLDELRRS